jgi:hypothetical protein
METKVFSVEDVTLNISANDIYLFVDSKVLATTNVLIGEYNRHILHSTLIRTPKIYPHTITVEHDGDNYLWETIKAKY